MNGRIAIKGLRLFGKHGVTERERELGQTFSIDLEIVYNLLPAAKSDSLDDTVDYASVVESVKECFDSKRFNLLEALASAVADDLMDSYEIEELRLEIKKTKPPLEADLDYVSIAVERKK